MPPLHPWALEGLPGEPCSVHYWGVGWGAGAQASLGVAGCSCRSGGGGGCPHTTPAQGAPQSQ